MLAGFETTGLLGLASGLVLGLDTTGLLGLVLGLDTVGLVLGLDTVGLLGLVVFWLGLVGAVNKPVLY